MAFAFLQLFINPCFLPPLLFVKFGNFLWAFCQKFLRIKGCYHLLSFEFAQIKTLSLEFPEGQQIGQVWQSSGNSTSKGLLSHSLPSPGSPVASFSFGLGFLVSLFLSLFFLLSLISNRRLLRLTTKIGIVMAVGQIKVLKTLILVAEIQLLLRNCPQVVISLWLFSRIVRVGSDNFLLAILEEMFKASSSAVFPGIVLMA